MVVLVGLEGLDRTDSSAVAVEEQQVVADSTMELVVAVGSIVGAAVVGIVLLGAVDNHMGCRLLPLLEEQC